MREYLSIRHRDDPEHGCPSAALLDEIGRCPTSTKQAYTEGMLSIADEIASRLAPDDPQSARATTLSLFALLIGTLQLSRALADRQLADEVLERGIENALALLAGERVARVVTDQRAAEAPTRALSRLRAAPLTSERPSPLGGKGL